MQIKIRAWHTKLKKMFSCEEMVADQMCILPDGRFINVSGTDTRLSQIDNTGVMIPLLWTGLFDTKGKEIYEGDIIKVNLEEVDDDYRGEQTQHEVKYFVGDNYPAFDLWPHIADDCNSLSYALAEYTIEVLGNIYENPELLKEVKNEV